MPVIHCPQCRKEYNIKPEQLGVSVTCGKRTCGHTFRAEEDKPEPEVDDEIEDFDAPEPPSSAPEPPSRVEKAQQPRSKRLDEEEQVTTRPDAITGRILFWSGLAMILLALLLDTSVGSEHGGRIHNMSKAQNQTLLIICGMCSTISGAAFAANARGFCNVERALIALWLMIVTGALALPLML